jgi:hypothetical protein
MVYILGSFFLKKRKNFMGLVGFQLQGFFKILFF